MSTCSRCKNYEGGLDLCWKLAALSRDALKEKGVTAAENIRVGTKPESSCPLIDELQPGEVGNYTKPEVTNLDVLRAQAAAYQSTAYHWRKQCERTEIRVRELEQALVEAGRRAEAFGMPLPSTLLTTARAEG